MKSSNIREESQRRVKIVKTPPRMAKTEIGSQYCPTTEREIAAMDAAIMISTEVPAILVR